MKDLSKILIVIGLALFVAGYCKGDDPKPPPEPYNTLYAQFKSRVEHGLNARLYVGVKPAKGQAHSDDLWVPSGSYGLKDGIYNCSQSRGKATLLQVPVPASGVAVQSPFVMSRVPGFTQDTTAQTVGGVNTQSLDGTQTVPITTPVRSVVQHGGTKTRIPC